MDGPRSWQHADSTRLVNGDAAVAIARASIAAGDLEVVFNHRNGACLMLVTNGERAMLVHWPSAGDDDGVAAVDPSAGDDRRSGYVLSNGQVDTYADAETVALDAAMEAVRRIVDTDELDPRIEWRAW